MPVSAFTKKSVEHATREKHAIFRPRALRHHARRNQDVIFPRWTRPRTWLHLWAVLAVVVGVWAATWWTEIPDYAPGVAITPSVKDARDDLAVIVPGAAGHRLNAGARIWLMDAPGASPRAATLSAIEPQLLTEEDAPGLIGYPLDLPETEVWLAWARWGPEETNPPSEEGFFSARIEIGRQRLFDLCRGLLFESKERQ